MRLGPNAIRQVSDQWDGAKRDDAGADEAGEQEVAILMNGLGAIGVVRPSAPAPRE